MYQFYYKVKNIKYSFGSKSNLFSKHGMHFSSFPNIILHLVQSKFGTIYIIQSYIKQEFQARFFCVHTSTDFYVTLRSKMQLLHFRRGDLSPAASCSSRGEQWIFFHFYATLAPFRRRGDIQRTGEDFPSRALQLVKPLLNLSRWTPGRLSCMFILKITVPESFFN